jgi:hypothetical protein
MNQICSYGFACKASTDRCVAAGNIGQPCMTGSYCKTGVCKNQVCVQAGGLNQPCFSNGTCLSGLYCNYRKLCVKPSYLSSSTAL